MRGELQRFPNSRNCERNPSSGAEILAAVAEILAASDESWLKSWLKSWQRRILELGQALQKEGGPCLPTNRRGKNLNASAYVRRLHQFQISVPISFDAGRISPTAARISERLPGFRSQFL